MKYKLIINFKTYDDSFNFKARNIFRIIRDLEKRGLEKNVEIIVSPNILDLRLALEENLKVFSQHLDEFDPGSHTGFVIAEHLKKLKVKGSIISHSEHQLN
jgi:triosephosphate isomerase